MTDYTELKRLAEAALRNWPDSKLFERPECERFIDASRPDVVLALIAENERLKSVSNFQEAVACVFDFAKIAAANTGCRDWDEQLEEFAVDVIEFAPEYKRQWLDIVKLAADNERLKADCSSMRGSLKANAASIKKLIKDGGRAARERDQLKAENDALRKDAACVDDLSALVRQLVHRLRKAAPDNDLPEKALDYLKRKGLQGSPFRNGHDDAAEREAQKIYDSWAGHDGFVPWVKGGNSIKQDEARRLARAAMGKGEQS